MKTIAIIPAGGKGIRSGNSIPKQYLKFNSKELIVYTLQVFQKNNNIDEIIAAASPEYISHLKSLKKKYKISKLSKIVEGGKERQDSVFNALLESKAEKNDLIAVHDAARPLLPQSVLSNAVKTAKTKGNAVVCLKSRDTILKGKKIVDNYLDRNLIYQVQTPQIFKFKDLMKAMEKALKENYYGTDESSLIKNLGKKIYIVEGSFINFKVTESEDISLLKKILK